MKYNVIKELVAQGKIEEAFEVLSVIGNEFALFNEVKILQANYNLAKDNYQKGIISYQEFTIGISKINQNLIELVDKIEKIKEIYRKLTPEKVKSEIRQSAYCPFPEMIFIKGGTFKMGNNGYDACKPVHEVTISDYFIDKNLVTVEDFKKFIEATGYTTDAEKNGGSMIWEGRNTKFLKGIDWRFNAKGYLRQDSEFNHPVLFISFNDVTHYSKWINKRLPTEAEWEYAARGGSQSKEYDYSGGNNMDEICWCKENSNGLTHAVGLKKPNEIGIFDLTGNVWEWCNDWFCEYPSASTVSPRGPSNGQAKVVRGGSWNSDFSGIQLYQRYDSSPEDTSNNMGFRLAWSLDNTK